MWPFASSDLTPHGFCLLWDPGLIWLHIGADLLIAISYYSIPTALLLLLLRRREDLTYSWLVWLFAGFILACGTTHLLEIVTLWFPEYWLEGALKAVTAALSVATAAVLWPLVPSLTTISSPVALIKVNQRLSEHVEQQRTINAALSETESELRSKNEGLETRIIAEVAAREAAQSRLIHAEQMEALGQLAGGVAHDFNNVLQVVASGATLIEKRPNDSDAVRSRALKILDAAERGAAIVTQLLAFARRSELQIEAVDVRLVFKRLTDVLDHTLGANVHVGYRVSPDVPLLTIDRQRLETLLINLATNARDAMPATGGTVTFSASLSDRESQRPLAPHPCIFLVVEDDGCGMDASVLKRATEPFFTTKPQGKGTGLGLSMARGFAEQMGGSLDITSSPSKGTTVTLCLPIKNQSDGDQPDAGILHHVASLAATHLSVLLVDDDPIVRELLAEELSEMGATIEQASSGTEALSLLGKVPHIDVLISDYSMPGMNGVSLIREVRRRNPLIKTILLTGLGERLSFDLALPVGTFEETERPIDLLLRKPITGAELGSRAMHLAMENHHGDEAEGLVDNYTTLSDLV